jgi:hypothetical protein
MDALGRRLVREARMRTWLDNPLLSTT